MRIRIVCTGGAMGGATAAAAPPLSLTNGNFVIDLALVTNLPPQVLAPFKPHSTDLKQPLLAAFFAALREKLLKPIAVLQTVAPIKANLSSA